MTIRSDIQKLAPGSLIELFVVEIGTDVLRFHAGVNELGNDVVWRGETYVRYPVEASGFELKAGGTLPRPRIRVANVTGLLSALVHANDDLVGARVTRKRTLLKYVDAVNFPGGVNPSADPNAGFRDEIYFVDRKAAETAVMIEFELAAAIDMQGVQLPRRQFIQNVCAWLAIGGYRGPYCGYTGGPVADQNDSPVADLALDRCGGRLTSCKLRFGQNSELPFGGFPTAGLIR